MLSEILCTTKVDGVVLDAEHGLFDIATMHTCAQVILLCGKRCFVRLQIDNKSMMQAAIDSGCDIIVADVDPRRMGEIFRFCNEGTRGTGLVRANTWGKEKLAYKNPILIAQIESSSSVQSLVFLPDDQLECSDFFMIGPYDLSRSLGDVGNFSSEKYLGEVRRIEKRVGKKKMGIHLVRDYYDRDKYEGYGVIAVGMDTTMLMDKAKEVIEG